MRRQRRQGFTLIEVILAITLAAMILALTGLTFFGIRRSLEKARGIVREEVLREQVFAMMERELKSATLGLENPNPNDLLPDDRELLTATSYTFVLAPEQLRGEEASRLAFVSLGQYTLPGGGSLPAAMEVQYRALEPEDESEPGVRLVRAADSTVDGVFEEDEERFETLLTGLQAFRFEVYRDENWTDTHDAREYLALPESVFDRALPRAVRVTLEYLPEDGEDEGETFVRVWLLDGPG